MDELKKNPEKPDKTDQPVTDNPISPIIVKSEEVIELFNALHDHSAFNYNIDDRVAEILVPSDVISPALMRNLYMSFKSVTFVEESDERMKINIVYTESSEDRLRELIRALEAACEAKAKESKELA